MKISRFQFIAMLGGSFAHAQARKKEKKTKWYITGGRRATQTDCDVEPIVCYGTDRLDALGNSGITVWSAEEWEASNPEQFKAMCKTIEERP